MAPEISRWIVVLASRKKTDHLRREGPHWTGGLTQRWGVVLQIWEADTVGTASLGTYLLHPIRRGLQEKVVLNFMFFGRNAEGFFQKQDIVRAN